MKMVKYRMLLKYLNTNNKIEVKNYAFKNYF